MSRRTGRVSGAIGTPSWRRGLLLTACLLLVAHVAVLSAEWLNRCPIPPSEAHSGTLLQLSYWPYIDPIHWMMNFGLSAGFLLLACGVLGSVALGVGLTVTITAGLAIANYEKVQALGAPLFANDATMIVFGLRYLAEVLGWYCLPIGLIAIMLVAGGWWSWRRRHWRSQPHHLRLLWTILGAALLLCVAGGIRHSQDNPFARWGLRPVHYRDVLRTYHQRGLLASLATQLLIPNAGLELNYCQQSIERIAAPLAQTPPRSPTTPKPHIIFWLSESLSDPTRFDGVSITPDPLANVRALGAQGRLCQLLVPTFGGQTSRTLFEMVTGLSNMHVPACRDAFCDLGTRPFPSLARLFASNGYDTLAVHAGLGDLFNAPKSYRALGFARYDWGTRLKGIEQRHRYSSDMGLTRYVIDCIDKSPRPLFAFVASMQNHAPYDGRDYASYRVQVKGNLSEAALGELRSYAQGVYEADQALAAMVQHFQQTRTPVVMVFYGDHLPPLMLTYVETGYFARADLGSLEQEVRRYSTPALVWTNTTLDLSQLPPQTCPPVLSSQMVQLLGYRHPFYVDFLKQTRAVTPCYAPAISIMPDGQLRQSLASEPIFRDYELLTYDLLYGRQYALPWLFPEVPR